MSQSYRVLLEGLGRAIEELSEREALLDAQECQNPFESRQSTAVLAYDAHLRSLERDSAALEAMLASLRMLQGIVKRRRARAHNAAQPCCRLPREILSNIFEADAPSPLSSWHMTRADWVAAPIDDYELTQRLCAIGATCSWLRAVLLESPRCWTTIHYIFSGDSSGSNYQSLKARLARSKNYMLDLRLDFCMHPLRPSHYTLETITHLLRPHMHRCRSLLVWADDRRVEVPLLLLVTSHSIEHLSFRWSTVHDDETDIDVNPITNGILAPYLIGATSLLSLEMIHAVPSARLLENMQVHSLTRLRLMARSPLPDIFRMLGRCSNLEHLSWRLPYDQEDGEYDRVNPPHLVMNSLVSLVFETALETDDASRVLLDAPKLEQLQLWTEDAWSHCPFDILHGSQPHLPSLRRIQLSCGEETYDRVSLFLRHHPQITELHLEMDDRTENAIEHFPAVSTMIQSFIPGPSLPHPPQQHITFVIGWKVLLASEQILAAFWHVLRECPELQLRLQLFPRRASKEYNGDPSYAFLKKLQEEFESRITLSEDHRPNPAWPCAWPDSSSVPWC